MTINTPTLETETEPEFKFDFGVITAIIAIIALLTGIGIFSENYRNTANTENAKEQLTEIITNSQTTTRTNGTIEAITANNELMGQITYDPTLNKHYTMITDYVTGETYTLPLEQSPLSIFGLDISTLPENYTITKTGNTYIIQAPENPKECLSLTADNNLLTELKTVNCTTGETVQQAGTITYHYGK